MAFTTLDPVNKGTSQTLSGGNLTVTGNADGIARSLASFTGKTHFEVTITTAPSNFILTVIGVCDALANLNSFLGSDSHGDGITLASTQVYAGSSQAQLSPVFTLTTGDTLAVEVDPSVPSMQFQKVGAGLGWEAATTAGIPAGGTLYAAIGVSEAGAFMTVNFGASTFLVSPTSGYTGLDDGISAITYILLPQAVF